MEPRHRLLTIMELAHKLDIPKPTLRFWEKELEGIIVPDRTPGGQRRYSENHIKVLEKIKGLREAGKSLSEIKTHLNEGDNGSTGDSEYKDIDILSERIAEVVRTELQKFFNDR